MESNSVRRVRRHLRRLVGGLMIWGFEGGDRWQDQASVLLQITAATTLAAVAVSYVRRLF
jgi:hypothetical protein